MILRIPLPFADYRLAPNVNPNQLGIVFKPVEDALGPVGQVQVTPYDAVGLDPYLFPQARTNNTFQIADTLTYFRGNHTFKVGADVRRTQLNSSLDRNYRTQVIYGGSLDLTGVVDQRFPDADIPFVNFSRFGPTPGYFRGSDLASLGLPTGIFQSLSAGTPDSTIGLRFWQQNYFFNGNWRARPGFTIDYGVRYEYNSVPREVNNRIENTFDLRTLQGVDPNLRVALSFDNGERSRSAFPCRLRHWWQHSLRLRPRYKQFIGGRTSIYDSDRNNFGPHFSFAWDPMPNSPTQAGKTVIRGGFGVGFDIALGSVVSQSRNVFPTFIPTNLDVNTLNNMLGVFDQRFFDQNLESGNGFIRIINPHYLPLVIVNNAGAVQPLSAPVTPRASIICAGSLNQLGIQPGARQALLGLIFNPSATNLGLRPSGGGLAFTLPDRQLRTPYAYHYNLQIEREFFGNYLFNAAYVGTRGLKLIRFRTPNGGLNSPTFPVDPLQIDPNRAIVPAISLPLREFPGSEQFQIKPTTWCVHDLRFFG